MPVAASWHQPAVVQCRRFWVLGSELGPAALVPCFWAWSQGAACPPQCTCINTNSGLQPTAQQAHVQPWSTGAAANRGQDDHGWKEGRIEEEEGTNKGKVRNSKSHSSQTLNTPSTLINLSPVPRKTNKRRVRIPPRYDHTQTQQLKNRTRHTQTQS